MFNHTGNRFIMTVDLPIFYVLLMILCIMGPFLRKLIKFDLSFS
jgi:hypothetical protein